MNVLPVGPFQRERAPLYPKVAGLMTQWSKGAGPLPAMSYWDKALQQLHIR